MTQRNEPTIGNTITSFFAGNKKRGHKEILDSALDAFTKAEQELNQAISLINDEVAEESRIALEAEKRMADAKASSERLNRVLNRVKAITE